ncbi:uncharacterized protein F5147DRAFT_657756 [Suillus discolor]|uniref:Uncharacterized protein n=1 Tax=Suillus discolor TaxID=1912936 RepID=A0A9P7EVW1_9AGAM|nr:uncharacterized protein F5147DRAFT_657756 [Suillus discolor]KAG2092138.1 hypothetical protein F5147DRAFT_657756 [Suillus discolor]
MLMLSSSTSCLWICVIPGDLTFAWMKPVYSGKSTSQPPSTESSFADLTICTSDIEAANILLAAGADVKLPNFGVSRQLLCLAYFRSSTNSMASRVYFKERDGTAIRGFKCPQMDWQKNSFHEASIIKEIAATVFGDVLQAFIVARCHGAFPGSTGGSPCSDAIVGVFPLSEDRPYLNVWLMLGQPCCLALV